MTIWYVRPDASHGGTNDGTSYANAWQGWSSVVWGVSGVSLSDTLYICGTFSSSTNLALGAHLAASSAQQVILRGDYPGDPGIFVFSGTGYINSTRNYTTFKRLTINGMTGFSCILHVATAGGIIEECELIGGTNGVGLGSSTVYTSCIIRNNIIHGQSNIGINHTVGTGSITPSGIQIVGNTVYSAAVYGIQVAMNSSAWTTSKFTNYLIKGNTVTDCPGGSIYFRSCHNDTTTAPSVYSADIEVSGNSIANCGTVAGDAGAHGGITVMGVASPVIFGNVVRDTYVTGGGIQTAKNLKPEIFDNSIYRIRSGTPTSAFQNGVPIDGNGIFFDNLTVGGVAYANRISDLVSTGAPSSGVGIAMWDCQNVSYFGNIIENCNVGISYGYTSETNNMAFNNTIVNCAIGVVKVGSNTLTGNVTIKNNIFHRCTTGFSIGSNPSIDANYNCVFGATTPYSGISAGSRDVNVDSQFDSNYNPQNAALIQSGVYLGGKDFNKRAFYSSPNIGAIDSSSAAKSVSFSY